MSYSALSSHPSFTIDQYDVAFEKFECLPRTGQVEKITNSEISDKVKNAINRLGNSVGPNYFVSHESFVVEIALEREESYNKCCCFVYGKLKAIDRYEASVEIGNKMVRKVQIYNWDREIKEIGSAYLLDYVNPQNMMLRLFYRHVPKKSAKSAR